MAIELTPIGMLHTCFKEKFGIPRQPNLVKAARGVLEFYPEFARPEAVQGLEAFSHVWVIFLFHKAVKKKWSSRVRPPRLGGNKKIGVFATRAPFRPNSIGMSCLKLESVEMAEKGPQLHLSGVDILDKTPVLDIKPYISYADSLPDAVGGFAPEAPEALLGIQFSDLAESQIQNKKQEIPKLLDIITGILENDPRPSYMVGNQQAVAGKDRIYGIRIFDVDLKWQVIGNCARVLSLDPLPPDNPKY